MMRLIFKLLLAFGAIFFIGCGGDGGYTVPDEKQDTVHTPPPTIVTLTGKIKKIDTAENTFVIEVVDDGRLTVKLKIGKQPPTVFVGFSSDFLGRYARDTGSTGDLRKKMLVRVVGAWRKDHVLADTVEWLAPIYKDTLPD